MRPRSIGVVLLLSVSPASAQQLNSVEIARIDSATTEVLASTGAPSASLAIVRGGQIVYEHAYGTARINPVTTANTSMRYGIGSVSKQFTATAILMLAEEGRLSLDDKVQRWFPELTRADEVSIRQLLSMTAGYQDYWPQDYVMTGMMRPTTAASIIQTWAGKALDFDPGTRWQYSNTNYVIAGAIASKVAGMPIMTFLQQRIFMPLRMTSVMDVDAGPLHATDAEPLMRNALGPLRVAPKEAPGWLMSAGQLAMTPHDLALWDISVMNRTLLTSSSYELQQTVMILDDGRSTGYGLGVSVGSVLGHKRVTHGGAVSGYTTTNDIYPDDKTAVVVITNIYPGAAGAPEQIAARIAGVLFPQGDEATSPATADARRIYEGLMQGRVDRARLTDECSDYFSAQVLEDYAASLGPLGAPTEFAWTGDQLRGGMTIRSYRIRAGSVVLSLTTMTMPDGKIDQYIVQRAG